MLININLKHVLSLGMIALATLFSACDDSDEKSTEVVLSSFGPSGVKHGEKIKFIGQNLDKVKSILMPPNVEIPSSAFASQSASLIELIVPAEAETGKVILKTPDGDIESKTVFNLEVPVTISSITSEARPGTNITITGDKLNWIEAIMFPSELVVQKENFVSQSLNELIVTVPMEAQTGFLAFLSGGTEPLVFASEEALIVSLPDVTTLTPSSIKHMANLTLGGTNLDLVTQIKFTGAPAIPKAEFESQSETEIVITVPATTTSGELTLTAPSGVTVETDAITIILPNVTAFAPSNTSLHTPGTTLTVTGTDLDLVKTISFPGVVAPVSTFESQSSNEIKVVIPAGAQGGSLSLKTIHDFVVPVSVPFGDQLTLAGILYDDAVKSGFGQWGGWGSTVTDWANTEQIRVGSKAIKLTFPASNWVGGAQFGGGNISTAGTAAFAFSIYGGAGTGGKKIQLVVKTTSGDKSKQVTIAEGSWTDVSIPLSEWGNPTNITELFFQNVDFGGTVYIDQVGLK